MRATFYCRFSPLAFALGVALTWGPLAALGDDWPQWMGPKRDGVWRETGVVAKFPAEGPKELWRRPIGGGYAGPAVAGGRVYVTDRQLATGAKPPDDQFQRGQTPGMERILCLDDATGEILWKHEYDCPYTISYPVGPRCTPVVDEKRVYSLGAEGHLKCLDAASGDMIWERDLKADYNISAPLWGFAAHPLIDGDRLFCIVGGEGSVAVAFDKKNGDELWRNLTATEPGYCPPVMVETGGTKQLIIWNPSIICSLNPANGRFNWWHPFQVRAGLSIAMPRLSGDYLFISSFYNGSKTIHLRPNVPEGYPQWEVAGRDEKDTEGLHCLMSTPYIEAGYIYGVCSYGQLRCIRMQDGARVWETLAATGATGERGGMNDRWANAFLIRHEDRFFIANEKGDLIIAKLSPEGYEEVDRKHLLDPTGTAMNRDVLWSHPAFANKCIYWRNDKEIVKYSLAAEEAAQ